MIKTNFSFTGYLLLLIITIYSLNVLSTDKIDAKSAKNFIGEIKTVCGRVVSTSYRKSTPGRPIFINFVRDYPDQFFTGLIWMDRAKDNFSYRPDKKLRRKRICVKGRIQQYNNIPQIVINTEKQISFDNN